MKKTAALLTLAFVVATSGLVFGKLINNKGRSATPGDPLELYHQVLQADQNFDMNLLLQDPSRITRQSVDRLNRLIDSVADLEMSGKEVSDEAMMGADNAKRFLSALWQLEAKTEQEKHAAALPGVPVSAIVTQSSTADSYEPDNTMADANEIAYGDSVTGHTIDPGDDVDWYKFEGNEGDYVHVLVSTPNPWDWSSMDPLVDMYDENGHYLTHDYDSGDGHDAELIYGPLSRTATYYLRVRGEYRDRTGPYTISLNNTLPNWNCDNSEPNDSIDNSVNLDLGSSRFSCIYPPGDVDVYSVQGNAGKLLIIRAYGYWEYGTRADLQLKLLSPSGDSVLAEGHNEDWINPVIAYGPLAESGTYFVIVQAEGGTGNNFGQYRISAVETWPVEADQYEPDDGMDQCSSIQFGETQHRTIFPVRDRDYVCFEASAGQYIEIRTETPENDREHFAVYQSLLDQNGHFIDDGAERGKGYWGRMCYGPLPYTGRYVIFVEMRYWSKVPVGEYSLTLSKAARDPYEPDDDLASANELEFAANTGHTICPGEFQSRPDYSRYGDTDVFAFTASKGDTIYAQAWTPDPNDDLFPSLYLADADSTVLGHSWVRPHPTIVWRGLPDSGRYYLIVRPNRWYEGTVGDYTLYFYKPPRANFASDKNVGLPPLTVHFENQSYGGVDSCLWDMAVGSHGGNGIPIREMDPVHQYVLTGEHEVSLTVWNPLGSSTKSRWTNDTGFIHVYGPCGYTQLVLIDSSSSAAFEDEGWNNAIDGDIWGWDGTATVTGNPPYATFTFKDGRVKTLTKIRLLTNTGVGYSNRWVRNFHIDVSTDGVNWSTALTATHQGRLKDNVPEIGQLGWWQDFYFDPPVQAKFVKLVIDDPVADWAQIGEFEVYEDIQVPEPSLSSITVSSPHFVGDSAFVTLVLRDAEGKPVCGYDANDITFFLPYNEKGSFGTIVEVDSGVYKTTLTCDTPGIRHVMAAAHGAVLPAPGQNEALTQFYNPGDVDASLQFVSGSETHPGEGWDNAIDGDIDDWDGTVTATGNPCYAIFSFGGFTKTIDKIGILTDTGVGYEKRWVCKFQLQVSTTDTADTSFHTVMTRTRNTGEMVWYKISPPVQAKFIKLILLEPYWGDGWRQLGEFVVHEAVGNLGKQTLAEAPKPEEFSLSANYPNPFNPTTNIRFTLPEPTKVKLVVFNTLGQKVATLVDDYQQAGVHVVTFDASNLPSGIYFYKIQAGHYSAIRKMVLTK